MDSMVHQFEHSPLESHCRFESLLQWLLGGSGHGWIAALGLLLLGWYFPEKKQRKNRDPKTNCCKTADQLCTSPTTSLPLLWPQTKKNTAAIGPSQQCFRECSISWGSVPSSPCWQPLLQGKRVCAHTCVWRSQSQKNMKDLFHIRYFWKFPISFCFLGFLPLSIFAKPVLVTPGGFKVRKTLMLNVAVASAGRGVCGCGVPPGREGCALLLHPASSTPGTEVSSL